MRSLGLEFRQAVRTLLRSPGFTLVAGVTLALGIAANGALFAVAKGVLLEPLPYAHADRLVRLWSSMPERGLTYFSVSAADYADWKAGSRSFDEMAAFERQREAVVRLGASEPQRALVANARPELFDLLGIAPQSGRVFNAEETAAGARVATVTDGFWRSVLGARADALGQSLVVDGEPYTIVGIMPPSFSVPGNPAVVWTPLDLSRETDRGRRFLRVFARLREDVSVEAARTDMQTLTASLAEQYPGTNRNWSSSMMTLNENVVGPGFRRSVLVLLGVVGLVLLIAAANVTNMMLSRVVPRSIEAATRRAMGATRARVMRSWLIESALLGLVAGVAGMVLAVWGIDILRALQPPGVPRIQEIRIDATISMAVLGLALLAGIGLGLGPALLGTNVDVARVLREVGRGFTGARRSVRMRNVLLMSETALTLVLLIGAALLIRSFWRITTVPLGFDPDGVLTVNIALPVARYDDDLEVRAFFDDVLENTRALPGVVAASAVSSAPLGGPNSASVFVIEGRPVAPDEPAPDTDYRGIMPGYFSTMGIRLISGRDFTPADRGLPDRVIISESMARRFWPGEDPIGQRVRFGDLTNGPWRTVIGVSADVRYQSLETPELRSMVHLPHGGLPIMTIVARTGGDPAALATSIRQIVTRLDPELAVGQIATEKELVATALGQRRFHMILFGLFGALALVLAAVGSYGVIAYVVSQRTAEIGVRMALGANTSGVFRVVVGQALAWGAAGIVIGLVAAGALTDLIAGILFQTEPRDPAAFLSTTLLLLAVTLLASWLPARRAARLDPAIALRG
ncbi:MAG: ABC transporter permease [Gemmatimonadetes bacterium]|nr:ABC transporter permease [Gemmatimonadota bacterium]